ncbi:wax ester/triacylglycerol synthase family O-acyltransferase [Streptomyces sp. WAC05374]|uniref:wax ester/triacylglycerol synthase family O-acyltransferase n=1 Tax=Streptomyces sp. WAC05374 TaxID=2487420 RepID=UPI000F89905C|nr:wax ester/triacylglycerol synthase family O-acyltransferase [Streptomyces sp. WAC05374]RST13388.1 wax ester/triacylglycerol synthase family O-acyltransferase [Streptomyces sp. WAC05374]TDF37896.1 wax ester/triacylglycerol synthase family O-acyltransferase [Streptomyces sp. WAC05374]TDF52752.1 wax ester/triacylglycerol synthase family O-acyltransferase [Streptomyces sp. WAC05374]TDF54171.1 wax ester/triacylglycerol synthase family O-acyltransferase [Streptomyces sp. WAC05374]
MSSELLAPLDLAFWHLETADHPMHLGALARFDPGPGDPGDVLDLLRERAAAIPRLRMRVRDVLLPVGGAAWSVDKDFDVRRHVRHVPLPGDPPDVTAGATRLAGELMERPLERGRPPWEMYLLTGAPGGPFAVLVKLHHALADGMRAVAIGAGIFDEIAGARTAAGRRRTRPVPPRSWLPGPLNVADAARGRLEEFGRALGVGASVVRASRLDPRGTPALTAGSSGTRRLATVDLDLEEVRRVRRFAGGTANDVLLAVTAGALRHWMLERGERPPTADPRALVPVSRRRPGGAPGPGNTFSAYLLDLPLSDPDPLDRLHSVRRRMDRNKAAGPTRGAGAVAVLADQLPPLAHRFGAPLAQGAARMLFDVLVTNVPLPRSTLSLGGCPLRALHPMAPLARGQALAVAMSPYGGQVHIGLVADGKAVPDVDRLAHAMADELAELVKLTRRT